jgi:aminoglycoside/choline kinase family phosphotransferase
MGQNTAMTDPTAAAEAAADGRKSEASRWAAATLGLPRVELSPVSGDASFRRYFRLQSGGRSMILMDAPPDKEDSSPFVDIDGRLRKAGLNAPEILHFDLERGFGLLEDFGDRLYRELIDESSVDRLFPELFSVLHGLATRVETGGLPHYGRQVLQQELDLFTDWYLGRHKGWRLELAEADTWRMLCDRLIETALAQPQVFVHKDFHSCNLLETPGGPGIIDFQDGLRGPIAYDFASLVWDRYISWPRDRLVGWMMAFRTQLGLETAPEEWVRWCDWIGLQRNLKIVGIFARLRYRDGRLGYLEMIPRFYAYLLDILPLYPEFEAMQQLLERPECAP